MKNKAIFLAAACLALIDQLSKNLIEQRLENTVNVLGDFIKLEYSQNTGIAFGIPIPEKILLVIIVIMIAVIIYFADKELNLKNKISQISMALILGGAVGNLIDRFTRGYVVDFIAIGGWPNFNLADSFICIAVLLVIVFYDKIKKVKK
jgi:signal peptidase II